MNAMDNYLIQIKYAQERFLTYDQDMLIQKLRLQADDAYLYIPMLGKTYRLSRATGSLERLDEATWVDANTFSQVLTLLDVLCDSRQDRYLSGSWQTTGHFGQMFHRGLLEPKQDDLADLFHQKPGLLQKVCHRMGGRPVDGGDEAYAVPMMDGMELKLAFWAADEEFPAQLRFFWDKNALMYIRYETMHYALGLLRERLREESLHFL